MRRFSGPIALLALVGLISVQPCRGETKVPEKNRIINPDFDTDLMGWSSEGTVSVEKQSPIAGKGSLRIGPGKGAVRQRYVVGGLKIVYFGAMLKAESAEVNAQVRVQCYDAQNKVVMDLQAPLNANKEGKKEDYPAIYFKTQANTASIVVSIEKTSDPGSLYADTVLLADYDHDLKSYTPLCDLDQYLEPFWKSKTVYNETVLLFSKGGQLAHGKLLFTPDRILSVRDYSLSKTYKANQDYTLAGNVLSATASTHLPFLKDSDIPKGDMPWLELPGKQVVVTYTHRDRWQGPVPAYLGKVMPQTIQKLTHHQPLVVVTSGDSITLGIGTSSNDQIAPYMPTWAELFVRRLKKLYGDQDIRLYNTALGGMTSQWGLDNADSAVAALEPDLVIIAYGMNDFWWMSPDDFKKNIQSIIDRVRARRPNVEFVLISSMRFDPAYTADAQYRDRMLGYAASIKSLTGPGVCELDMTAISGTLFQQKEPKSILHDPLHPNDFLARWYAQGLISLFAK